MVGLRASPKGRRDIDRHGDGAALERGPDELHRARDRRREIEIHDRGSVGDEVTVDERVQ